MIRPNHLNLFSFFTAFMSLLSAGCGSQIAQNTTALGGEAQPVSPDFGGTAISVNYVPGSGLVLGAGFSSLNNEIRPKCIEVADVETAVGDAHSATGQHVETSLSTVSSYEDLESQLGIDASFSMGMGFSHGDMSVSYSQQKAFNSQDYFLVMRVSVVNQTETLKSVRLTDAAVKLLNQSPLDFLRACGDHYFSARTTGGTFSAVLQISSQSQSEKESIKTSLEAGGMSWNTSMDMKLKAQQDSKIGKMNLKIIRDGDGEAIPETAKEIIGYGLRFNTLVGTSTGKAYPLRLTSSSYGPLALLDPRVKNSPIDPQADLEIFDQMGKDYLHALSIRNDLTYAVNNPTLFARFDPNELNARADHAQAVADSIRKNAGECAAHLPAVCFITYKLAELNGALPPAPLPAVPHLAKALRIQTLFHTQGSQKDASDGIWEHLRQGSDISAGFDFSGAAGSWSGLSLGGPESWGKGLTFHDGNNDQGQIFDVSSLNVTAHSWVLEHLYYTWSMDQPDHEWDVKFTIVVTMEDGRNYVVFSDTQARAIGGNHGSSGYIPIYLPANVYIP